MYNLLFLILFSVPSDALNNFSIIQVFVLKGVKSVRKMLQRSATQY